MAHSIGGMEDKDIIDWMNKRIRQAKKIRSRVIVFLDEINTCNCMGLFKEIMCDRSLNGVKIPDEVNLFVLCIE